MNSGPGNSSLHDAQLRGFRTYGRSRALRHPDLTYAGEEVVHLTICAACGEPFRNPEIAKLVCDSILFYTEKLGYRLYAYCLMFDHLHVLISPNGSGVPLSKWLQALKSFTGHAASKLGCPPPLWQRSAYDHVCRETETAGAVAAYVAENPVRKGLVNRWEDWPWTQVLV